MARMTWWPLFGITRRLTERKRDYPHPAALGPAGRRSPLGRLFRRSLFVYPIDVGSSNALNMEVAALRTPQYNIHRFGIFFTDTPRHADLLLVLGRPTAKTWGPLEETIAQLPRPFGVLHLYEPFPPESKPPVAELPNLVARVEGVPSAEELLALLRAASRGER